MSKFQKLQDTARVTKIWVPDALNQFNIDNNTHRGRLEFIYVASDTDNITGADDEAQALLSSCRSSAAYSCIIDMTAIEGETDDDKAANLFSKLEGKNVIMTTYVATIADLTEGKHTFVNDGKSKTFSSLSDSYIGKFEDGDAAFQRIKDRLNRQIDDLHLEWGEYKCSEEAPKAPRH